MTQTPLDAKPQGAQLKRYRLLETLQAERIAALEQQLADALREIEVLRQYGNKDCTAMADTFLRDRSGGAD